jgi:SRSO17 transposase
MYLPQNWAEDRKRGRKADVPEGISFETKPESPLEHLRWACEISVECGVVLLDAVEHGAVAARKMSGRATTEIDAPRRQSEACRDVHAATLSRKTVTA